MPRDKNIFTLNPTSLDMKRSVFSRNCQHKTTFNLGEICPVYFAEILPGDTVTMDVADVIRTTSPMLRPVMDNMHCDCFFFFVPNRLVWSNWQQFCGENETGAWTNTAQHSIPVQDIGQITQNAIGIGSIGDHFGLPVKDSDVASGYTGLPNKVEVSELPLRAYFKIYNDWFRDENNIAPVLYTIGDSANTSIKYSGYLKKASRFHDLFSSCLPAPQKGASVSLPLGVSAPVKADSTLRPLGTQLRVSNGTGNPTAGGVMYAGSTGYTSLIDAAGITGTTTRVDHTNLYVDLQNATGATINALRTAFQVQKLLERDARGGTRYIELLRAHFGVTSPDARLQRSEYIAGQRFRINVDQVVATADSGSSGSSIVGETGALSKTVQGSSMFTKSFVEHGMLIGLVVIRQDHTYSQGLDKYWLKKDRFDFFYPVLANIGEVPVYKSELNVRAGTTVYPGESSGVFGYQEAWYDYRFAPSRCTGYMNPIVNNSFNDWTLGDAYTSVPGLNQTFLEETPTFLNRALAVGSSVTNQFMADFYFKAKFSRVMPLYSIPGLIDHH